MPKILLTLLVIIIFSGFAQAQFSKGSLLVGGELSFSGSTATTTNNQQNQNQHSGNFNVSIGKAISENSVFGVNLSYIPFTSSNYNPYGYAGTFRTNTYIIGVFYRKYKSLGKDFYLFGEAGAGYSSTNSNFTDSLGAKQPTGTTNGGQLSFMPGIAYKISKKFFIEITVPDILFVSYSNSHANNPNPSIYYFSSNSFSISTSLNSNPLSALGIGFRLNL